MKRLRYRPNVAEQAEVRARAFERRGFSTSAARMWYCAAERWEAIISPNLTVERIAQLIEQSARCRARAVRLQPRATKKELKP